MDKDTKVADELESVAEEHEFNDAELDDIMAEIESLEKDLSEDPAEVSVPESKLDNENIPISDEVSDSETQELTEDEPLMAGPSEPVVEDVDPSINENIDGPTAEEIDADIMMKEFESSIDENELMADEPILDEKIEPIENTTEFGEDEVSDDISKALGIDEEEHDIEDLKVDKISVAKTDLQKTIDDEVDTLLDSEAPESIQEDNSILGPESEASIDPEAELSIQPEPEPEPEPELASQPVESFQEVENSDNVVPINSLNPPDMDTTRSSAKETQMSFSVKGKMDLTLGFKVGRQSVQLYVSEDKGFTIELDGGATFKIPLNDIDEEKKAS